MEASANKPMTLTNAGFVALPEIENVAPPAFQIPDFGIFAFYALLSGKARVAARTLARAGGVWIWPSIP